MLLIHCRAGIGRSTAAAYVATCWRHPEVSERRIAELLRRVAPLARPNETVVRLFDTAMNRGGRMSAAISETGRDLPWIDVEEGVPFQLPPLCIRDSPDALFADVETVIRRHGPGE